MKRVIFLSNLLKSQRKKREEYRVKIFTFYLESFINVQFLFPPKNENLNLIY